MRKKGMRNHGWHKKKRKRGRPTSDSGSSSNIGWMADTSSLCLDYKRKKEKRKRKRKIKKKRDKKKWISQQVYGIRRRKGLYKNNEEKVKLEITYSSFSSGGCRRGTCLPFAALGPIRRRSISKWPWSSRLRLAYNRVLATMGMGWRRRRALKNYITYGRKTTLKRHNVSTGLRRVIPSLGRLRLGRPRC